MSKLGFLRRNGQSLNTLNVTNMHNLIWKVKTKIVNFLHKIWDYGAQIVGLNLIQRIDLKLSDTFSSTTSKKTEIVNLRKPGLNSLTASQVKNLYKFVVTKRICI